MDGQPSPRLGPAGASGAAALVALALAAAAVAASSRVALASAAVGLGFVLVFATLHVASVVIARRARRASLPVPAPPGMTPRVSIHVPCSNEPPELVVQTLEALGRVDWPDYEVLCIDNNTPDQATWQPLAHHCRRLGPRFRFYHRDRLEGAKAGALNLALELTDPAAEYVAVVDADYCVSPSFLRTAHDYLWDGRLSHAQFPQAYRNGTRCSSGIVDDFSHYFDAFMPIADRSRATLLTGTMLMIRRRVLAEVGGWRSTTVTEDAELGARLALAGHSGRFVPRIVGRGVMPTALDALRSQRRRWVHGNAATLRNLTWRDWGRLDMAQRIGVLAQLSAWFNGMFLPAFVLAVLGIGAMAGTTYGSMHASAAAISGVAILAQLVTRATVIMCAPSTLAGSTGRGWQALTAHFGLTWEGATAWLEGLFGVRLGFIRTDKTTRAGSLLAVLPGLAGAVLLGLAAAGYAQEGMVLAGAGALAAALAFAAVFGLAHIAIVIPAYNRADCLGRAVEAALAQRYSASTVTIVDDGSTDTTARVARGFASEPRFSYIRLARNVGAAQAKNVALMCCRYDAITFHDSDDVPSPNKVLLQARALMLEGHKADEILNWEPLGHVPHRDLAVDVVVSGYELIKMDGSVHYISKRVSLLDDFFPNLQFPAKTEGDWCLVNCGLFRRTVFERLGGFLDSIEEDRELRNRTIAAGCIYYFIDRPLLTKIEMRDSLTMHVNTGYQGELRRRDRQEVWRRLALYRSGLIGPHAAEATRVAVDLGDVVVADVLNPANLTYQHAIAATPATSAALGGLGETPESVTALGSVRHE